ncbi:MULTISPECIES: hypothetical protein [Streptomyces]|uniref:hypothetical protein n=1 Tax=Streptomyces TaxID=1883 RepID=UPI000ABE5A96|nr:MULTISPECIES: hypothetical protein [unclassified Streptomyces]MCP3770054.1 hypothetical protein [Streptomyces sp. MAR25Y5]
MHPKRYLALLGVPLGASFLLIPSGSAQAAEASPSVAPGQTCRALSSAPPNPFGNIVGSGFNSAESVRVSADGQVIATRAASGGANFGEVSVNGVNLSARSYVLEGLSSGKVATCAGLTTTSPTQPPPDGPVNTRDEGRKDGLADGLAGCRQNRVVTDAQEDEEGPRNADYFAGYAVGKAEALNRAACLNKAPQTTRPGENDRGQQGRGDGDRRDQQNRGDRDGGGNR